MNAAAALGQLGPIGIALVILIVMWALNRQTRVEHEKQIAYFRGEVAALRDEVKGLRADLAVERAARRDAEEAAHKLRIGDVA